LAWPDEQVLFKFKAAYRNGITRIVGRFLRR
jgi:hypothetical protein